MILKIAAQTFELFLKMVWMVRSTPGRWKQQCKHEGHANNITLSTSPFPSQFLPYVYLLFLYLFPMSLSPSSISISLYLLSLYLYLCLYLSLSLSLSSSSPSLLCCLSLSPLPPSIPLSLPSFLSKLASPHFSRSQPHAIQW